MNQPEVKVAIRESDQAGGHSCECNAKKFSIDECDKLGTMINGLLIS